MLSADQSRFGCCSGTDNIAHEMEKRYLGNDDQYAEVTIFRCKKCRRCWLHYLMEYEYLTASGRWLEGEISPQVAASLKANEAIRLFDDMPWFHCSGSAFGGKLRRVTGPAAIWLTPFPAK